MNDVINGCTMCWIELLILNSCKNYSESRLMLSLVHVISRLMWSHFKCHIYYRLFNTNWLPVSIIIRLMLSLLGSPEVITLSGFYCTLKCFSVILIFKLLCFLFSLTTKQKSYLIQTLNEKDLHDWLYAINPLLAGQIR